MVVEMVVDEVWSRLVSAGIDSIIELFIDAIDETEEKLNELITAPLTAGKGFLKRAEREPQNREYLIVKAQDKFTEMVAFEGHPYLQYLRQLWRVGSRFRGVNAAKSGNPIIYSGQ